VRTASFGVLGIVALSLVLAWAAPVTAADAPPPPPPPPAPVTTADPTIDTGNLTLLLRPMTAAELKVEADGWQGLLKAKATAISKAEVEIAKATDAKAKDALLADVAKMREEQTRLIDRLKKALDAIKAKGGKVDDYDLYISAVSGITLNVTDAGATWTTIVNWAKSGEGGVRWGKNIVLFIVTILIFKFLAGVLGNVTGRMVGAFKGSSELLRDFFVNVVRKVTVFVGFVIALSMLEFNIGPFLAAMGAIGFVIAFALQGTLSNFAAGVMILLYRPYDLGERATIAGQTGKVSSMTLVSTLLTNDEGKLVTIPNSMIWGGVMTNHSHATPVEAPKK
jgi:small conductance mechanosensitive channel